MKIAVLHGNTHQRAFTMEEALNRQHDKMTQPDEMAFVNGYHTTGMTDTQAE